MERERERQRKRSPGWMMENREKSLFTAILASFLPSSTLRDGTKERLTYSLPPDLDLSCFSLSLLLFRSFFHLLICSRRRTDPHNERKKDQLKSSFLSLSLSRSLWPLTKVAASSFGPENGETETRSIRSDSPRYVFLLRAEERTNQPSYLMHAGQSRRNANHAMHAMMAHKYITSYPSYINYM